MTSDQLKTWRIRLKWTQAHAAHNLGISPRHYRKLEAGSVEISRTLYLASQELLHFRKNRINSVS